MADLVKKHFTFFICFSSCAVCSPAFPAAAASFGPASYQLEVPSNQVIVATTARELILEQNFVDSCQ